MSIWSSAGTARSTDYIRPTIVIPRRVQPRARASWTAWASTRRAWRTCGSSAFRMGTSWYQVLAAWATSTSHLAMDDAVLSLMACFSGGSRGP